MVLMMVMGCDDAKVGKFNSTARHLDDLLNSTGNDDADVIAACSAVENAFKQLDSSKVSKQQANDMEMVADDAQAWRLQLTTMMLSALSAQMGGSSSDTATDMEIGRLTFPSIRSGIAGYVKRYAQ